MTPHDTPRHPAEYELAEYLDGLCTAEHAAEITAHLAACPACRALTVHAAPTTSIAARFDPDHPHEHAPASTWPNTDAAGAPAALPAPILTALRARQVAKPAPGQVWRLRAPSAEHGREHTTLVAIVDIDGNDVLVAPVTADERSDTDLWTVRLPLGDTDVELAVWVSLEASVGFETLDVLISTVPSGTLDEVHTALRRGDEPPRGLRLGRGIDENLQHRRDSLRTQLAEFSAARLWTEPEDDDLEDDAWPEDETQEEHSGFGTADAPHVGRLFGVASSQTSPASAADVLRAAGYDQTEDVAGLLGVTARQARQILQGTQPLTVPQLALIERVTMHSVRNVHSSVPAGWVRELGSPLLRADFDEIAEALKQDPWTLRAEQVTLLPAARGNRGDDADYAELARHRVAELRRRAGLE